jgi:hypothetical protein
MNLQKVKVATYWNIIPWKYWLGSSLFAVESQIWIPNLVQQPVLQSLWD